MESLNKKFIIFLQSCGYTEGFALSRRVFQNGIERSSDAPQQIETEKISVNTAEIAGYVNERQIHSKEVFDQLYNPIDAMEVILRKKMEAAGKPPSDVDDRLKYLQKEALQISDEKTLKRKKADLGLSLEEMDLLEYYWDQGVESKVLNIEAVLKRDNLSEENMQTLKAKKDILYSKIKEELKPAGVNNKHFLKIEELIKQITEGVDESAQMSQKIYIPLTEVEYQEKYREIYSEIQAIQLENPDKPQLPSMINNYFDLQVALKPEYQIPEGMKTYLGIEQNKLENMRVQTSLKKTALKSKTLKIATVEEQVHQMKDLSIGKKSVDLFNDSIKGVKDFVGNIYNADIPPALKLGIFGVGTYFLVKFLANHKKAVGYGALGIVIGEAASLGLKNKELFTQMLPELFTGISLKSAEKLRGIDEFEKIVDKRVKNKDKNQRIKTNFANLLVFSRESKMNALDYLDAWKNKDKTGGLVDIDTPLMTKKDLTEILDFFFTYVYQPSVIERDCRNEELNLKEIDFEMLFANWLTNVPEYQKKMKEFEGKGYLEKLKDKICGTIHDRWINLYLTPLSIDDKGIVENLIEREKEANGTSTGWTTDWWDSIKSCSAGYWTQYIGSHTIDCVLPEKWHLGTNVENEHRVIGNIKTVYRDVENVGGIDVNKGSIDFIKANMPLFGEEFIENFGSSGNEELRDFYEAKDVNGYTTSYYISQDVPIADQHRLSNIAELSNFLNQALAKAREEAARNGVPAENLSKMRLIDAVIFTYPEPSMRIFTRIPAGREYIDIIQGKQKADVNEMREPFSQEKKEVLNKNEEVLAIQFTKPVDKDKPNDFALDYQRLELFAMFPVKIEDMNDILTYITKNYLDIPSAPPFVTREKSEEMILNIPVSDISSIVEGTERMSGRKLDVLFKAGELETYKQNLYKLKQIEDYVVNEDIREYPPFANFPDEMEDSVENLFREKMVPPLRAEYKMALLFYNNIGLLNNPADSPIKHLLDGKASAGASLPPISSKVASVINKINFINTGRFGGRREVTGNIVTDDILDLYKKELRNKVREYRDNVVG